MPQLSGFLEVLRQSGCPEKDMMIWLKQESMSPVMSSAITVKLDHTASMIT